MIDKGLFEIRIGGVRRGQESFAIRRQGEEYMAVGRTSFEGEEIWLLSAEVGLRTDARFVPVRYEFRTLQRPSSTTIAVRTGSRIRVTTSNQDGERMTELVADRELVLIQTGVAHHYWFLIKRFGKAAAGLGGTVDALAPDAVKRSAIRLEAVTDVDLALPGGPVREATRYDMRIGDTVHIVWVERATGHILRAEIPERAWVAVRVFEPTDTDPESAAAGPSMEGAR
ncbi:MAG: hypothetical protein ACWGON_01165 [Gemmatimonadota bacterium]